MCVRALTRIHICRHQNKPTQSQLCSKGWSDGMICGVLMADWSISAPLTLHQSCLCLSGHEQHWEGPRDLAKSCPSVSSDTWDIHPDQLLAAERSKERPSRPKVINKWVKIRLERSGIQAWQFTESLFMSYSFCLKSSESQFSALPNSFPSLLEPGDLN